MENAIIIRANNQFKSKSLNTATAGLAKAFKNIENGRKDACAILAKVERNKSYEEDGFKSLAEYAETIGLEKSLAHKMENAGRMLISEDEEIKAFADKTDFSKLAILSSAPVEKVKEAIQNGDLSPETTQSEVKALKADFNKSDKTKVLPRFKVHIVGPNGVVDYDDIELEMIPEIERCTKVGTFEQREFHKDGDKIVTKWTVYADVYTGDILKLTAEKVKKEAKKAVKSPKEISKEDLIALAEKYGMKVSFTGLNE